MNKPLIVSVILSSVIGVGCGGGTEVTTNLLPISTAASTSVVAPGGIKSLTGTLAAGDTITDVTIESLKIPILDVSLGTGEALTGSSGSANTLYDCGSDSGSSCMVELVGTALSNLLTGGTRVFNVEAGTYTSVMVGTCSSESSYTASIKAKATIDGTTYYTKTSAQYMTSTESEYSPVDISFTSCRNYSILAQSIAIGETATTVNLYFDLRSAAVVSKPSGTSLNAAGNCTLPSTETASGTAPYLCLAYPNVAGAIGDTPTLKRFRVSDSSSSTSAKIIGVYLDSSGNPVGGYDRPLFDTTYVDDTNIFGSFKKAYLDGTNMVVTDYKDGATDTIAGNGDNTFPSFPIDLDVGATQSSVTMQNSDGTALSNTADITRLD